ncbi:MAG: glycerophosphodiester phosphodiesterase family protein [Salegentibacter sp.]
MKPILKIGHRGAKGHVTENTLDSIERALEFNIDAIEVDVHRCSSGELVVFHDFTLDRITNGRGEVAKKNWSQLKKLKVGENYRIPLLTEVMDFIEGKCGINIELKGLDTADAACEIVEHYVKERGWKYEDIIVSSFQKNELFEVRRYDEHVPIGVLSKASMVEAIELGKILNAKAIHPSLGIITRDNVKRAHDAGFKVNVWTVNEPGDIERMKKFGVNGIISDFPDRL